MPKVDPTRKAPTQWNLAVAHARRILKQDDPSLKGKHLFRLAVKYASAEGYTKPTRARTLTKAGVARKIRSDAGSKRIKKLEKALAAVVIAEKRVRTLTKAGLPRKTRSDAGSKRFSKATLYGLSG